MATLSSIITQIDQLLLEAKEEQGGLEPTPLFSSKKELLRRYIHVATGRTKLLVLVDDLFEVMTTPQITALPNLPAWILGVINIREEIVSVIDINSFFFQETTPHSDKDKIVILQKGKMKVGFLVNKILTTTSRPDSERISTTDTPLAIAAPEVFDTGIEMDRLLVDILEAAKLFAYSKFINYYQE